MAPTKPLVKEVEVTPLKESLNCPPPLPSAQSLKACAANLRSVGANRTATEIETLARMLREECNRTD